jgi:hypothetical protein
MVTACAFSWKEEFASDAWPGMVYLHREMVEAEPAMPARRIAADDLCGPLCSMDRYLGCHTLVHMAHRGGEILLPRCLGSW